ncbi:hypothetical protein H0H93_006207 [Arthromyces matolae]|nr:hypothetical protein H0H93_006207 [Arthromyces matolae]
MATSNDEFEVRDKDESVNVLEPPPGVTRKSFLEECSKLGLPSTSWCEKNLPCTLCPSSTKCELPAGKDHVPGCTYCLKHRRVVCPLKEKWWRAQLLLKHPSWPEEWVRQSFRNGWGKAPRGVGKADKLANRDDSTNVEKSPASVRKPQKRAHSLSQGNHDRDPWSSESDEEERRVDHHADADSISSSLSPPPGDHGNEGREEVMRDGPPRLKKRKLMTRESPQVQPTPLRPFVLLSPPPSNPPIANPSQSSQPILSDSQPPTPTSQIQPDQTIVDTDAEIRRLRLQVEDLSRQLHRAESPAPAAAQLAEVELASRRAEYWRDKCVAQRREVLLFTKELANVSDRLSTIGNRMKCSISEGQRIRMPPAVSTPLEQAFLQSSGAFETSQKFLWNVASVESQVLRVLQYRKVPSLDELHQGAIEEEEANVQIGQTRETRSPRYAYSPTWD